MATSSPSDDLLSHAVKDLQKSQRRVSELEETLRKLQAQREHEQRELQRLRDSVNRESNSRLLAEEALGDTTDRLEVALGAAGLALWDWDIAAGKIRFNARWQEMTGDDANVYGIQARTLPERVHPDDLPAVQIALGEALKGRTERYAVTHRLRTATGWIWIESHGVVTERDMLGRATHMIGTHADITDRKNAERELERARDEAQAASRARSDFLANISHEVRTPLNGILGLTQLLVHEKLPPEQAQAVQLVDNSARALLALLKDVLDFSTIEAGELELNEAPFALEPMLMETSTPHGLAAREKGLQLTVRMDSGVPARVVGDEQRLRQVIAHLLSNAVKYTRRGEVELAVLKRRTEDGRVLLRFEVADTGIGIAPEKHRDILKAFTQADGSMTRKHGGAGLGLAIVDGLVSLMGGKLKLASLPDQGSVFSFELELRAAADAAPEQPDAKGRTFDGLHVLLVEDHAVNQLLMQRMLAQLGCEVELAANGMEAVSMWKRSAPDLVLMDVQMPGMSGLDATIEIRRTEAAQRLRRTPIVALTAHAMQGDRDRCIEVGMDGYTSKPVLVPDLVEAMTAALGDRWKRAASPLAAPAPTDSAAAVPLAPAREAMDVPLLLNRLGHDSRLMLEIATAMREDLVTRQRALEAALATRDGELARTTAHALKGALTSLTADRAAMLAKALETAARREAWDLFGRALPLYVAEAALVDAVLQRVIGGEDRTVM
ncbi:response regulator [Ramlibacter sp.]|uniref:response regulator n=1 Tax=Ramlibacter sp. TaxID=1917967 RepID=UPI003D108890